MGLQPALSRQLAKSGAIQVFGTRDLQTAEYLSQMLGHTTGPLLASPLKLYLAKAK